MRMIVSVRFMGQHLLNCELLLVHVLFLLINKTAKEVKKKQVSAHNLLSNCYNSYIYI